MGKAGPVPESRQGRTAPRPAAILISAALLAAFAAWHLSSGNREADRALVDARRGEMVKYHAGKVTALFENISRRLSDYAGSDGTRKLFQRGDQEQLAREAGELKALFPAALKVRLLLPGRYGMDSEGSPPLSFASMDILGKAEKTSGAIAAESLLFGTEDQHIVIVERVKNAADQLIGIIHLSLDVKLLQDFLDGIAPVNDYLELRQSGSPLVLASRGEAGLKPERPPATASIAGTRWVMAYWDGQGPAADGGPLRRPAMLLSLAAGLLAAAGILVFLVTRKDKAPAPVREKTARPEISYAGAIKAIMEGAHPGMEKLITNMPGRRPSDTFVPGISEGLSGADDITAFLSRNEVKAAAENGDVLDLTRAGDNSASPGDKAGAARQDNNKEGEAVKLSEVIFRKYDIRGVTGENLTPEVVMKIGQAIGTEAEKAGQKNIAVGRDGRLSSPELADSLVEGLKAAGRDVIDIGVVPTPVLYFATHHLETKSGVMLTGSHNGPEYNGLKIVLGGDTLSEGKIKELYRRIRDNDLYSGTGSMTTAEVIPDYIRRITGDIPVVLGKAYKLVVDCGNGVAGVVAPQLYRAMGHDVIELYCDLDGNFPNHHPDPSQPENMQALIAKVREEKAHLGFAFDGDADRLGVVDGRGNIIWPDRQMLVFARDVLSRNPGAEIIYDVKCTGFLKKVIEESGGRPLMWKTGHSLIKKKMKEVNAPLAGEMSGHVFFKERWYGFDDALYAGARLLEILVNAGMEPTEFFAGLPEGVSTPELRIDMPEGEHQGFMQKLESKISFDGAEVITVDGFRVEFSDGWGLIRPSNTTPCLIIRFEADNREALDRIQAGFRDLLLSIKPDLHIPF